MWKSKDGTATRAPVRATDKGRVQKPPARKLSVEGGGYPPLSVNFFPLGFRESTVRGGVADTFWLFIFTLNRAKKWFNSIFNSKLNQKYSFKKLFIQIGKINSKNYSIQNWIKNIHSNWKNNLSLRKQWKTCKMGSFFLKTHLLFIFLMNIALFWFIQKFIQ